ncbi:MAG: magnesium transporter CorA family protein [Saprospiraceae bacterium]|nr:magnesium transporter CorA family protein [Saprospiraceae bacterium]
MLKSYIRQGNELIETDTPVKGCWINIYPPFNLDNLKQLSEELSVPLDFLTDSLDPDERSRFEEEEDVRLVVLNAPIRNKNVVEDDALYVTIPIGIITTKDFIITISSHPNEVLDSFLNRKVLNFDPANKGNFVIDIFDKTVFYYTRYLKDLNRKRNQFEDRLEDSMKNEDLLKMSNIQNSLVYFNTAIRANELLMAKVKRVDFLDLQSERDRDLLEDVMIDNSQALEMSMVYTNILNAAMDTFASIISNNLNNVMKRLTSITIILMIPTLVASFYGMNVAMPFKDQGWAFPFTILLSTLFVAVVIYLLRKQRFL